MNIADKHPFAKVNYYLSLALACFPLLPLKAASILIIVWALSCGLAASLNSKQEIKKGLKYFLLFSSVFWLALIALLYTVNISEGMFLLEKNLSLLVFPLCFWIVAPHFTKSDIRNIFYVFTGATLALTIYAIVFVLASDTLSQFPAEIPFYYKYRTAMEQYSGLHPSYFSLLLLFSALFIIDVLIRNKWTIKSFLLVPALCILFVQSVFLASRLPLTGFTIALAVMILSSIRSNKLKLALTVGSVAAIFLAVSFIPSMKERISELQTTSWQVPQGDHFNATNIRVGIYKCSWELISENWLTGLGYGDIQENLNHCYSKFDTPAYKITPYNTHSIYLNAWLGSGLLGIMAVLLMLIIPLVMSVRSGNNLYLSFLIFFLFCGLTENILNRQIGIVFYCYINMLLFTYSFRANDVNCIK